MDDKAIKRLLRTIEEQLQWGNAETWASRDFEELNILIFEKTKVSISSSTLRRLWGKADYKNQPSLTTLDTLAKFAGSENWKKFCLERQTSGTTKRSIPRLKAANKKIITINVVVILMVLFVGLLVTLYLKTFTTGTENYTFSLRPVTHDLPNTVVFTYDAHSAAEDSVFIQQSWDSTRKVRVSKNGHLFNSIYYKPGFYHAKLSIGQKVVKEHPLLIPTNGWLGLIDQAPIPVYLQQNEFITKNGIEFTASAIAGHHIPLEPKSPSLEFYNTGNFKAVPITDFTYQAEVKNDYHSGSSRCQQIDVGLYTSDIPISIPVSTPGCIAAQNLLDGEKQFKGSNTDLSAFGVDPSRWVQVTMVSRNGKITIMIDSKKAFTIGITNSTARILGLVFVFQGSARIRNVMLTSGNKIVFKDLPW